MSSASLEPRWPPRSPHEALLSSPSGRSKIREYHDRTSPTPSPLKRATTTPNLKAIGRRTPAVPDPEDAEENEDEETLQLQLQALEAKIKLKKLQRKRKAAASSGSDVERGTRSDSRNAAKENRPPSFQTEAQASRSVGPKGQTTRDVQIPASPQKKMRTAEDAQSPKKVILGIDKGLKGRNVSLKRAPTERSQDDDPFRIAPSSLRSQEFKSLSQTPTASRASGSERPKTSFSERISQSRQEDSRRHDHANQIRRQQSAGFSITKEEISAAKQRSEEEDKKDGPKTLDRPVEFSRDQILQAASQQKLGVMKRSKTTSHLNQRGRPGSPTKTTDIWINPNASPPLTQQPRPSATNSQRRARSQSPTAPTSPKKISRPSSPSSASDLFEPFSSLHLSKRHLDHSLLTKTFAGKSLLRLPDLLGSVKSPDYSLPDNLEPDYVVLAIIATKSAPLTHKSKHTTPKSTTSTNPPTSTTEAATSAQNTQDQGKFMILTLTDLKWTLDLYLFSSSYTRFWKLTPGTLIALLNPSIMPPVSAKKDTGRFSLTLSSADDTVLEIGRARDLGWCSSIRKDGSPCASWVDVRHTSVCEYHVDRVVERTRSARMEVAGMSAPFAPGGRRGGRTGHFGGGSGGGGKGRSHRGGERDGSPKGDGWYAREGPRYDRGSHSTYFMAPSSSSAIPGRSAAQLLDAEGFQLDRGGGSKEERTRKRLAEREREEGIARQLGKGGNGAGSEYLRLRQRGVDERAGEVVEVEEEGVDAASLGLKRNRAGEVQLSPIKRRRVVLQGMRGAEGRDGEKRTRFVTERGIRVAGRESLGGEEVVGRGEGGREAHGGDDDDDDDDGLDVV